MLTSRCIGWTKNVGDAINLGGLREVLTNYNKQLMTVVAMVRHGLSYRAMKTLRVNRAKVLSSNMNETLVLNISGSPGFRRPRQGYHRRTDCRRGHFHGGFLLAKSAQILFARYGRRQDFHRDGRYEVNTMDVYTWRKLHGLSRHPWFAGSSMRSSIWATSPDSSSRR